MEGTFEGTAIETSPAGDSTPVQLQLTNGSFSMPVLEATPGPAPQSNVAP